MNIFYADSFELCRFYFMVCFHFFLHKIMEMHDIRLENFFVVSLIYFHLFCTKVYHSVNNRIGKQFSWKEFDAKLILRHSNYILL